MKVPRIYHGFDLNQFRVAGGIPGFHRDPSLGGDFVAMDNSALLTDLYQLRMGQSYHALGMDGTAVSDFIVRRLPEVRRFLVAAGLEQVLD